MSRALRVIGWWLFLGVAIAAVADSAALRAGCVVDMSDARLMRGFVMMPLLLPYVVLVRIITPHDKLPLSKPC